MIFCSLTSSPKVMVGMGVPGPQNLIGSSTIVIEGIPIKRWTAAIRHPKSGDCIFPRQKGLTRTVPTVGRQTQKACWYSYVINHAMKLCFSHLEALIRLVFSPVWWPRSSSSAIRCYSPIQRISPIICLPKSPSSYRQMGQARHSRSRLLTNRPSNPPLMPCV